ADGLCRRHAGLIHLRQGIEVAVKSAYLVSLGREVATHRRPHHPQADKTQHHSSFNTASASTATTPFCRTITGFASASLTGRPASSASRDSAATVRASAGKSTCGKPR